jgi:hypothetical protein
MIKRLYPFTSLLAVVALTALVPGCGSSSEEPSDTTASEDDLTAAGNDYAAELRELDKLFSNCQADGSCDPADGAETPTQNLAPLGGLPNLAAPNLSPLGTTFGNRFSGLSAISICNALKPLAALENPYFFVGASAKAAVVKSVADGGADLVFDLNKQQAAIFHYHSHGFQNLIGVEASVYLGYGFGKKANVLDAWAGDFQTAEASVETPFLKLSVGGSIFRSPDNSIWGAAAQASFGLNALGPLSTVEVGVSEGFWTPWDNATRAFGNSVYLADNSVRSYTLSNRKTHVYLQFSGTRAFSFALIQKLGGLGFLPAAQAVGLAALKKKNLTITRMCGR